ncbi:hypothetical protein ACT7DD_30125 [Bacillus paranthracis]
MNKDITKDEHLPSESTTVQSAHLALSGETKGWKRLLPFLGPAFIASVAYIDPRQLCYKYRSWFTIWIFTIMGYTRL